MKAYNAWLSAKDGELIYRVSRPSILFVKSQRPLALIEVLGVDFSADDWEVMKKKHALEFTNVDFTGVVDDKSISQIIRDRGLERPVRFTKVYIEWED